MNNEIHNEPEKNQREIILKTIVKFSIIICYALCMFSCADREKAFEGISRGIYESSNDYQEMKREPDSVLPSDQNLPSYDQYKKEREKYLQEQSEPYSLTPETETGKSNAIGYGQEQN